MKIERIKYEPGLLVEFYEEGLSTLGALCERTWHDRLEVVAEGRAATLWQTGGTLHEVELHFPPADTTSARDAAREVFPGCPLTFQLADALRAAPVPLDRFVLADEGTPRPPDPAVAEKLWRAQFPETMRWRLNAPPKADFKFSLIVVARCEIQAIDQHWSLYRMAVSLPGGEPDESLARALDFTPAASQSADEIYWPASDPARWKDLIEAALEMELADELDRVRARQENSLRRELERIDDYFQNYAQELKSRSSRTSSSNVAIKAEERLAAAKAEHARRRADQVARHEIRVHPRVDALLLVAERAWSARLTVEQGHYAEVIEALFVPRSRRWILAAPAMPE